MKELSVFSVVLAAVGGGLLGVLPAAADMLWNAANGFGNPAFVRCSGTVKDGRLVLTNIARGSQVHFRNQMVDPVEVTGFAFRYRATGTGKGGGRLYYSWDGGAYSDALRWNLPGLVGDGKWHDAEVDRSAIVRPETWSGGGFVRTLRFDPVDTPGGTVEFENIRFVEKATGEKAGASSGWPAVRRVWAEELGEDVLRQYSPRFSGKMIAAADDRHTGGAWTLSKCIKLRAEPVQAWFQVFGDEQATGYLNGQKVVVGDKLRQAISSVRYGRACVLSKVWKGKNEIRLVYQASGGRLGAAQAELFVRYGDGSYERFVTDETFRDEKGQPAVCYAPPPAAPWAFYPDWMDYGLAQRGLGFSPEATSVTGGGVTILRGRFKGKTPSGTMQAIVRLWNDRGTLVDSQNLEVVARDHVVPRKEGTWELALPYTVPLYNGGGTYRLTLDICGIPLVGGKLCESTLNVQRAAAIPTYDHPPQTQVKSVAGIPEFHLDGKPRYLLWAGVPNGTTPDLMPSFGDLPINAVTVYADHKAVHPETDVWDFSEFDRQAELHRRANPGAYFVWDLMASPPSDWAECHPGEICCDEQGRPSCDGSRVNWSFFSKKAMAELQEDIARSIRYLERSPYANRIIGYRVNSGHTAEWLGWRPERGKKSIFDFSKPAKDYFADYLARFYPEIAGSSIPGYEARRALDDGAVLWDPAKHLPAIAFVRAHSQVIADAVRTACGCARKTLSELGRTKVVGTYYGYTATLNANGVSQMRGHYALERLLEEPRAVDFLMSPQNYGQRNLGDTCGDMKPFATLQAHGILPVIEDDTRTHNCNYGDMKGYFQTPDARHTRDIMRRNMAVYLCHRTPILLYAMSSGREFRGTEVARDATIARMVGDWLIAKKSRRSAEVAVVVSEQAISASPMNGRIVLNHREPCHDYDRTGEPIVYGNRCALPEGDLYNDNYSRLARSGVAFDLVLAEDLAKNPGRYKAYVFGNCFTADKTLCEAVAKLRRRDCSLVWLYAPGYSDGRVQSCENMTRLTGLSFSRFTVPAVAEVLFPDGHKMGVPEERVSPLFALKSADERVARYADGSIGVGKVKTAAATTWFSGAWRIDQAFARRVWRDAGVHVWTAADDPVEANDSLFTLHARTPGIKHIRLPFRTTVIDVFGGRVVARNVEAFDFTATQHGSYLFYYGDDAEDLLDRIGKCLKDRTFGDPSNGCETTDLPNERRRNCRMESFSNGTEATCQIPVRIDFSNDRAVKGAEPRYLVDFGKDGFGWLVFDVPVGCKGPYVVRMGEKLTAAGRVDVCAGGAVRSAVVTGRIDCAGLHRVPLAPDLRNTVGSRGEPPPVRLPREQGVVMPFRYVEIEQLPFVPTPESVQRVLLHWPIDMRASSFTSSSCELNKVYDFCKYSILATSFAGLYVDGDRERIPYEADAYINQLGHYVIDADYTLARRSHEYLMENPTWPTEWKQHSIMMAWADWMWSGETVSLARHFDRLAAEKLLCELARPDGLLLSGGEHKKGCVRKDLGDIVDWPYAERDGFVFRPVNTVVNAFHYRNLNEMADMATALGRLSAAQEYRKAAAKVFDSFNRVFWKSNVYVDGEGTEHASLHANAAALACGLVPAARTASVSEFLANKGMACSTYFSQYLLEALMKAGRDNVAVQLMSARGDRSWVGMMEQGATITMEAWNAKVKPNQDWNHAWGSVPLNVIARYVLGVTPLEPGFARISVCPQLGGLRSVRGVVPTPQGPVTVETADDLLRVTVPARTCVTWKGVLHEISAGSTEIDAQGLLRRISL